MVQSINEIIKITENLEVGDSVEFTDEEDESHSGEVTEIERKTNHRDFIIDSDGMKKTLSIWYDREGGPINVETTLPKVKNRELKSIYVN